MTSQIDIYQEMSVLSASMVEAARVQDWDRLVELEHRVAELRNKLTKDTGEGDDIQPDEVNLRRDLIQRILRDDAEVRRHTEPWMEQVRHFLGQNNTRRQVNRAYGVG